MEQLLDKIRGMRYGWTIGEGVFKTCESLERIVIPKGTLDKFTKLLPDDKDKLVEIGITR